VNKEWASSWIKSFGSSPEEAMTFYADDCHFEDVPFDQDVKGDPAALQRLFGPYCNKDPENGVGIHHFEVDDYVGDENSGFILWRWEATDAENFFGLDVGRKKISTRGITGHIYRDGKITREWTHSDQFAILKQLGYPIQTPHYWEEGWTPEG
jgi:steroid delta-isomerase-like uncharacterized protein